MVVSDSTFQEIRTTIRSELLDRLAGLFISKSVWKIGGLKIEDP